MISVVMPVFNAGPSLDECLQSIVNQTFTDFEFVILDDMSTDGSDKVLLSGKGRTVASGYSKVIRGWALHVVRT